MGTVIIILILIMICIIGVKSYAKKLASGCCGASGDQVKKIKVADKNRAHYPYLAEMKLDGMVCGNCAKRVENCLNAIEGVWASVDLGAQSAKVRMKERVEEEKLRNAVNSAGYTVLKVDFQA
ncbi:MAG: heavy metal-associated domain-containing protein [Lachnospiraceae bacterium]|nr:heavy-metal-associated domain-containing protein [Robinsoniella sp.]MDY3766780.1 heavy metal-associated domain-containing protein [Lachnospiraceae bacterium]